MPPLVSGLDIASLTYVFSLGALAFFSPCAFPLFPGYVSYYLGTSAAGGSNSSEEVESEKNLSRPRSGVVGSVGNALLVSLVVSSGFFLVYVVFAGFFVGLGSSTMYQLGLSKIKLLELVVGAILIAIGGAMAAGKKFTFFQLQLPERRRSVYGYLGFGVLYGLAALGCTAPLFVPVVGRAITEGFVTTVLILGVYATGMSAVMVGVTVTTALGRDFIVKKITRNMGFIYRVSGVLLILAGLYEVYLFVFRYDGLEVLGLK